MAGKRTAIVTGATGGLGREFVRLLAAQANVEEIWAVARNQEDLERLARQYTGKIRPLSADLSDRSEYTRLASLLEKESPDITYLVANAGYAKFCSYQDLSLQESLNLIDLNVCGVVATDLCCLPYMQQGARILNIASQASFQPLPYQNIYSSTKAFVRNYSRALGVELRDRGITVTAVCPGWIDTGLYARAVIGAERATTCFIGMVKPEPVARKALQDAQRGKDCSVYSAYVKFAHLAAKLLPQRAMMKLWLHQQRLS